MYKYRSEILFGEGYRDAANVMAHETFELMNTDIARTLSTSILKGTDAGHKLEILEEEINNYCIAEGDNGLLFSIIENYSNDNAYKKLGIQFFQEVLNSINNKIQKNIKYCLWLCDTKEKVYNYDIHNDLTDADIDVYAASDIILADIGDEGKLYGYEYNPEPITNIITRHNPKLAKIVPLHDSNKNVVDYTVKCPDCDMFICYPTEHDAHNTYKYCPTCGRHVFWHDNYI